VITAEALRAQRNIATVGKKFNLFRYLQIEIFPTIFPVSVAIKTTAAFATPWLFLLFNQPEVHIQ